VSVTLAQKPGLKFNAWDMAVSKEGRVHVAMGNNAWKLKLPQEEWALYYAALAPGACRLLQGGQPGKIPSGDVRHLYLPAPWSLLRLSAISCTRAF